ncbi:838_t:CDS:2 [Acaulospora morrowiae]|uniref:838_t:CDS:1 n=1 Tax=Acaulospora morrowiae TaxID=94023 RepID=A0A9N9C782_9GLOM|nr:838_t:CDS:2 [Acaulospora morrowiae]
MYSVLPAGNDSKTSETDIDFEKKLKEEESRKSQGVKDWQKKHGMQKAKGIKKYYVKVGENLSNDPLQILNDPETRIVDVHYTTDESHTSIVNGILIDYQVGTIGVEVGTGKLDAKVSSSWTNRDFKYSDDMDPDNAPKFVAERIVLTDPNSNTSQKAKELKQVLKDS